MDEHIEDLKLPEDIEPLLKEEDTEGLEKRDKKLVFALSIIEQKLNWCMLRHVDANKRAQKTQESLKQIRSSLTELNKDILNIKSEQRYSDWRWSLAKGVVVIVLAGFISAAFRTWFK